MASHEAYLHSALSKYRYPDKAKRDILNGIQNYSDLRPKLDTFVFNDGQRKELLSLEGTIPVVYRGNTYNIPVCLWLIETHPYNPPMVYVKPTSTMCIKPNQNVDNNGKVYLPYLHDWKHPQSDLLGLIQVLTIVFGENPPVFSRQANQPPPRPSAYPGQGQTTSNTPYPVGGGFMPMPGYPQSGGGYQPPTSAAQHQYPGYPTTGGSSGGYPPQGAYPPTSAAFPAASYGGYPNQTPYPAPQQTHNVQSSAQQQTLSEEQIKASLLSAVEDKMKWRLRETFGTAQAEMDGLRRTQEDLQKGKQTLEDMMNKLEREQTEVERNISILNEKGEEIKTVLQKMENRDEVSIDDAVVPTAPLYKQLLNAFAEEQATEDAIYYLGEALRRGVIDLDAFLKQVRELSRKQFMLRALIQKCREKAGLPSLV